MRRLNPFEDDYLKQELDFYGFFGPYKKDGVEVASCKLNGRCDDYLNVNLRFTDFEIPRMFIGGTLWMSITAMEIQSHVLPIKRAKGYVATAGLGLGYFALRVIAKDNVEHLDVYELDPRIIQFFQETFADRKGMDKISFIEGDARENLVGHEYDYIYLDIYQTLMADECPEDLEFFKTNNIVWKIDFWGQERVILDASDLFDESYINSKASANSSWHEISTLIDEANYFDDWLNAKFELNGEKIHFSDMYKPMMTDAKYLRRCLEVMGRGKVNENH